MAQQRRRHAAYIVLSLLFNTFPASSWVLMKAQHRSLWKSESRMAAAASPITEFSLLDKIKSSEAELQQAMLESNIDALDRLLDDDLTFTNHLGMLLGKRDDLTAHRDGIVDIQRLELMEMKVKLLPPTNNAIVTAAAHIVGSFAGDSFDDTLRFTRVWVPCDGDNVNGTQCSFKVVAAHSSVMQAS